MTIDEARQGIISILEDDDDALLSAHYTYYSEDGSDDVFYDSITFFSEILGETDDVLGVVNRFYFGKDLDYTNSHGGANPNADYFRFDGYANVESTNYPCTVIRNEVDLEEIADYIIENPDDGWDSSIEEILKDIDEDEDEE